MNDSDEQIRYRWQCEAVKYCQQRENEARKALADAVASTTRARERREELFAIAEKADIARKMKT